MSERRKFLQTTASSVAGFFINPKIGALGLLAAGIGSLVNEESDSKEPASNSKPFNKHQLIRSGEAVTVGGSPLGGRVSGLALVSAPSGQLGSRLFVVLGHDAPVPGRTSGISILEVVYENGRWSHFIAGVGNRRIDGNSEVPLEGNGFHGVEFGVGAVSTVLSLPWGNVLCAEKAGWIVEVNPMTGYVVKRFALGCLAAQNIELKAVPGRKIELTMTGLDGEFARDFKFISDQIYDPHSLRTNQSLFSAGELFVLENEVTHKLETTDEIKNPHQRATELGVQGYVWEKPVAGSLEQKTTKGTFLIEHLLSDDSALVVVL